MKLPNLQTLQSIAKKYKEQNKAVWDIVLYGSSVRGNQNPRDIDIAILLKQKTEEKQKLELAQELKESIEKKLTSKNIDVRALDLEDFLNPYLLARQGIIAESYLLIKKEYLANILGFEGIVYIRYKLNNLTPSQKKMFYYTLKGRRNMQGILKEINGQLISREVLRIPLQAIGEIEQILKLHKINYSTEYVMSYKKSKTS